MCVVVIVVIVVVQVRLLKEQGHEFSFAIRMLADQTKEAYPHATLLISTLNAYNSSSEEVSKDFVE